MPVEYARDDARRRVVVTVAGAFQTSDMFAVLERHRAEDTGTYGMLYDFRQLIGRPTLADLREIMGRATSRRPTEKRRGPVALLVTDSILYGLACTYAVLGLSQLRIQVFRDFNDADHWLTAETSPAN